MKLLIQLWNFTKSELFLSLKSSRKIQEWLISETKKLSDGKTKLSNRFPMEGHLHHSLRNESLQGDLEMEGLF